jgi:2-oxoglutarate ferredoxin oxidoreductase subunit delta
MDQGKEAETGEIILTIKESWCKGCAICVEFCPHDVLAMEKGKAKVINLKACTACGMCELRCPDFAIVVDHKPPVEEEEKEKEKVYSL